MTWPDASRPHDFHVHTAWSDDARDSPADMAGAAERAGLAVVCFADHVRASTTWVPEYVAAVEALRARSELELRIGVEAKVLDAAGRLDAPPLPAGVDHVLVADHRFPDRAGPRHPDAVRAELSAGRAPDDVLDVLVTATARAVAPLREPVVAHLLSVLPKLGLSERLVRADHLDELAAAVRAAGGAVELNAKWSCPGRRVARGLAERGVPLVTSTDAHGMGDLFRRGAPARAQLASARG